MALRIYFLAVMVSTHAKLVFRRGCEGCLLLEQRTIWVVRTGRVLVGQGPQHAYVMPWLSDMLEPGLFAWAAREPNALLAPFAPERKLAEQCSNSGRR
ncbi:hypothetical protein DFH07DRAFT_404645 [Mycena maculata]|uniref:Uncharacterized protein n=1 Tax=Mycena maculata TaxID=230809 RepID=A0AAD7JGG9_9AGAR|nr:hypothetical protein DFH07DRAFT_404645 [Mycena maculata]